MMSKRSESKDKCSFSTPPHFLIAVEERFEWQPAGYRSFIDLGLNEFQSIRFLEWAEHSHNFKTYNPKSTITDYLRF